MEIAEVKEFKPKDLDELFNLLETEFTYMVVPSPLREISFHREGYIGNGTQYKLTEWSLSRLLHLLKIPERFATEVCPDDLTETIVNRLKQTDLRIKLLVRDNTLVSIVPEDYSPPPIRDVIETLSPGEAELIRVSDKGVKLASITPLQVEPEEGDSTRIGYYLVTSETGGPRPKVRLMTFRLVCKNGAVAGDEWGSIGWRRKDTRDSFIQKLQYLNLKAEELTSHLTRISKRKLTDIEFKRFFNELRKAVGRETALLLLKPQASEERVSQIIAQARLKQRELAKPSETEIRAYPLYNEITQYARDLTGEAHYELMRLAGALIR